MKKLVLIVIGILLFSCKSTNSVNKGEAVKIAIDTLLQDKISIRALVLDHDKFWYAADQYTSETRRTSSHITIALPKELDKNRRIELSERLMHEFCGQYKMKDQSFLGGVNIVSSKKINITHAHFHNSTSKVKRPIPENWDGLSE